jgi:hypothetical protein
MARLIPQIIGDNGIKDFNNINNFDDVVGGLVDQFEKLKKLADGKPSVPKPPFFLPQGGGLGSDFWSEPAKPGAWGRAMDPPELPPLGSDW